MDSGVSREQRKADRRERDARIMELVREGLDDAAIAARIGVSRSKVRKCRCDHGALRGPGIVDREGLARRDAELILSYTEGAPMAELTRRFGISRERISQILEREGIPTRPKKEPRPTRLPADVAAVLSKAKAEGWTLKAIAEACGMTELAAMRMVHVDGGKDWTATDTRRKLTNEQVHEVWCSGERDSVLAERFGVSVELVKRIREARSIIARVWLVESARMRG